MDAMEINAKNNLNTRTLNQVYQDNDDQIARLFFFFLQPESQFYVKNATSKHFQSRFCLARVLKEYVH